MNFTQFHLILETGWRMQPKTSSDMKDYMEVREHQNLMVMSSYAPERHEYHLVGQKPFYFTNSKLLIV